MIKLMQYAKNIIYLVLATNLILYSGCTGKTIAPQPKTDIEKEFLQSFHSKFKPNYPVYPSTKIVGKTFWIYTAVEEELLTLFPGKKVTSDRIIKFFEMNCEYENEIFDTDYIFLKYTEEEKNKEKDMLRTSLSETALYQDFTPVASEILKATLDSIRDIIAQVENIDFFSICLADIKNGTKITLITHKLDVEQYVVGMLPQDEFYNRTTLKSEGNKELINDRYGISIDYIDVSFIDFLREQIINNTRSTLSDMEKYDPKQLEEIESLDEIIIKETYDVTTKYEFKDFDLVKVLDIIAKEITSITRTEMENKFTKKKIFTDKTNRKDYSYDLYPALSSKIENAEKTFIESFNTTFELDYPLHVSTEVVGKTFWIYIATEKKILTVASAGGVGGVMPEKIIKFLEINCDYENEIFKTDYIFLKYDEEEKQEQNEPADGGNILYQDYTDTAREVLVKTYTTVGDIIDQMEDMNFFVICLADIKRGTKITIIIHRLDMEQYLLGMLPPEEFFSRTIVRAEGSKDLLNDKNGYSINYADISLTDFLGEQIGKHCSAQLNEMETFEIKKLKELETLDDMLLESIYEVTTKYEFDDYVLAEIKNIVSGNKLSISKSRLINRFESPSESPAKLELEDYNF